MSMKLVPVWSVTIEPSGIGVPVAATPGLVPHDEVATEPVPELALPLALAEAGALLDDAPLVGADEELLLLLLLHPARTPPIAMTATAAPASRERRCSYPFMGSAFSWLTAKYFQNDPVRCPRVRPAARRVAKEHILKRCVFALPLHCVRCGLCSRSHRVFR